MCLPLSFLVKFVVAVALLTLAPSRAVANGWVVKKATGIVYLVAPGVKAFRAKSGMPLQPGYTVATKGRSRALIARGAETIFVGPNTKFAISKYRSTASKTTLLQTEGQLQVDVQKRARPHFTVETPFLAAVVKGTRFDVRVDRQSADVRVERGLVQVDDFASGDRANVGAGQSATSRPSQSVGLQVGGTTKPTVVPGKPKAPVFQTPVAPNVPAVTPERGRSFLGAIFGGGNGNSSRSNLGDRLSRETNDNRGSGGGNSGGGNSGGGNSGGGNSGGGNSGGGNSGGGNSGGGNSGGGNSGGGNSGGGYSGGDDDDDDGGDDDDD